MTTTAGRRSGRHGLWTRPKQFCRRHRIEKLLVIDGDKHLKGLITVKDIQKAIKYPRRVKMSGRLRRPARIAATERSSFAPLNWIAFDVLDGKSALQMFVAVDDQKLLDAMLLPELLWPGPESCRPERRPAVVCHHVRDRQSKTRLISADRDRDDADQMPVFIDGRARR